MTDRFQIDPFERRFRPNRQMNNDNFLVSCREVCSSENMLLLLSIMREGVDF